ncbi:hypothetical protein HYH02_011211 [Chlamydomonas schloesseri]|uniref:Uncharacterized protein n=1 Tax=Chlamydomonas schloesseri TaxID=2026947 RepID=A0A835TBZ0_9CHLO|nr:hypothetical protein HYH02_011211 [Chlamydomonas schloesseri]|eukprot:KAG2437569.1 hypothetical protein HYH02_011211 [Chlamydomonas schloesseri]
MTIMRKCSRLPPAELTHILKLIYTAGARTDRKLSLAALDKRGAGALYATTLAALREGCLMAEKRQLLLELLRQNVSGNLRCSVQAALRHQAAASSSTSPAGASSDSAAAAAGASTTPTAAAMPGEDCAWYERRVRRLSREDLDSLMSGRWLRQLMALLTPRVKAGEWEEAVAAASRVSRTLGKVLRRTPCPALAPLEHTVQAVARALVDDGSVRRGPSPWPLKTRNIVALLLVYHELMRLPADRVLAGTGLPKAHLQRWLLDSIERVHVHRVVSRTALLRQVRATIMVFDKQQQRQ